MTENLHLLPLDVPERVVSWRAVDEGGVIRRHILRPSAKEDAKNFYRTRTPKLEQSEAQRERAARRALLDLYAALALRAEGYKLTGGADLMTHEDWKQLIPEADRYLAALLVMRVAKFETDAAQEIDPECEVIRVAALWGEKTPGDMLPFGPLAHYLARLSAEDEAAMDDDFTRHVAVRGSRNNETIPALREAVLMKWYDRQIIRVEGYSLAGRTLDSPREAAEHMDPFHKIAAMTLFRPFMPAAQVTPLVAGAGAEDGDLA